MRVVERNRRDDTFGWGVVFSDQTLGNLEAADPATAREIAGAFHHWDDIDVHFRGRTITSGGHGFCGIGRKRLLGILQARCEALGVELVFEPEVDDDEAEARGVRRRPRDRRRRHQQPRPRALRRDLPARRRHCAAAASSGSARRKRFDAFTFAFVETPHGWFQAHAYQFDGETSTFIVETPEETWRAAGLDAMDAGRRASRSASGCSRRGSTATAADQRRAPARLGDLDPVSARRVQALGALEVEPCRSC